MKSLLQKPIGAITSLVMLLTLFLVPQTSLARNPQMSGGSGPGFPGGGEGDPLDSNDSGGGGGGGDVHERSIIPRDYEDGIISFLDSGQILILRVDYIDGIPVFTVKIVSVKEIRPEASHVR